MILDGLILKNYFEMLYGPIDNRNGVKIVWILVQIRNCFVRIGDAVGEIEREGEDGEEMRTWTILRQEMGLF